MFPPRIDLAGAVDPAEGILVDVGPFRHRVQWTGEAAPSAVSYCNHCGAVLQIVGRLPATRDPWQTEICVCAACHMFMGFGPREVMSQDDSRRVAPADGSIECPHCARLVSPGHPDPAHDVRRNAADSRWLVLYCLRRERWQPWLRRRLRPYHWHWLDYRDFMRAGCAPA